MKRYVSPKELSLALGASESSLKRWVDEGLLHAARTAGGHRRIAREEAVRFIRHSGMTVIDPAAIGLPDAASLPASSDSSSSASNLQPHMEELCTALIEGDGSKVRGIIVAAYLGNQSVGTILDALITPALHRIGEQWQHDRKGIFIEHRATSLCFEAIIELRSLFTPSAAGAPAAVGGALSGDVYVMPSLMAATVLAAEGWQVTNLGPQTPVHSLMLAAQSTQARLVWASISVDPMQDNTMQDLRELAQACEANRAQLIIGGRYAACIKDTRGMALQRANSMSELAAFAAGLRLRTP